MFKTIFLLLTISTWSFNSQEILSNSLKLLLSYDNTVDVINIEDDSLLESFSLNSIPIIASLRSDDNNWYINDLSNIFLLKHSSYSPKTAAGATTIKSSDDLIPVFKGSNHSLSGMTFDPLSKQFFVIDTQRKVIASIINETFVVDLIHFELKDKLHDIALDFCNRSLYWVNWNAKDPKIEKSNYDGSHRVTALSGNLSKPYNLVFDPWRTSLVFIDVNDKENKFTIESFSLTSSRVLLYTAFGQSPYALTVSEDFIIWSDWQNNIVWKLNLFSKIPMVVKRLKSKRPLGLSLVAFPMNCTFIPSSQGPKISLSSSSRPSESPSSNDNCLHYCIYGKCTPTNSTPTCFCDEGYYGFRCEKHFCDNYCLYNGSCTVKNGHIPICDCKSGYNGTRCQFSLTSSSLEEENFFFHNWFLVLLLCFLFIGVFLSLCFCLLKKRNLKRPSVVKARKTKTTQRPWLSPNSKSKFESLSSSSSSCIGNVLIEVEDCCQMTLCETPCVESTFRKAHHRSPQSVENDKQCLLGHQGEEFL